MLEFNLSIEAHDWEHDLHYLVKMRAPIEVLANHPEYMLHDIKRAQCEIVEIYKKEMIEKKFHLKVIK